MSPYGNIIEGAAGGNKTVSFLGAGQLNTAPPANRSGATEALLAALLPLVPPAVLDPLNQAGFMLSKASEGMLVK